MGSSPTTTFNDTAFAAGPTVTYRISAVNNDNIESPHGLALYAATFQDGVAPTAAYAGTADTWLDGGNPGANNGANNLIRFDGDNNFGQQQWALVKWDLSSIPADATLSSGAMTLFVTNDSGGQTYELYASNRNWVENAANFSEFAAGQFWEAAGATGPNDRLATVLGGVGMTGQNVSHTFGLNPDGVAQLQAVAERAGSRITASCSTIRRSRTAVQFSSREARRGGQPAAAYGPLHHAPPGRHDAADCARPMWPRPTTALRDHAVLERGDAIPIPASRRTTCFAAGRRSARRPT